jgi:hypothetical protein
MSRISRLKEYAKPTSGPQGATHGDIKRIEPWSDRATANSQLAPRASDGPIKLPDTGKVTTRDTASKPFASRNVDQAMAGKGDLNHVGGSDYMKSVRRDA